MERLHKFFRLPPRERIVLVQAWALFLLVELALRLLSFKALLAACNIVVSRKRLHQRAPASVVAIPRLVWLVEIAGRYTPLTVTCLKQALVLSCVLGRRGIAATLLIGVARKTETLNAHAWLEHNGQVICGQPAGDGFTTLVTTTMFKQGTL
jgi:hypothetical protein